MKKRNLQRAIALFLSNSRRYQRTKNVSLFSQGNYYII